MCHQRVHFMIAVHTKAMTPLGARCVCPTLFRYFTIVSLPCPFKIPPRAACCLRLFIHNSPFPANTSTGVNSALRFKGEENMKATGIVRRVDDLGRIVIPKEIRRTLRIREGDPLLKTLTWIDGYLWAMERLQERICF